MPLLNPPDVLPEAMRFIARVVLASQDSIEAKEVKRLVGPAGLHEALAGNAAPGEPSGTGGTIADKSLTALVGVGALERPEESRVRCTDEFRENFATWEHVTAKAFANYITRVPLARSIARSGSAGPESSGASDLAEAIACIWAMPEPLIPITGFETSNMTGDGAKLLQPFQNDRFPAKDHWPVLNKERFTTLNRWLPYLGFARHFPDGLIADSSVALREMCISIVDHELPIRAFLLQLADPAPYSDLGAVSVALWEQAGFTPDPQSLSPGLALTLRVLEHDGVIRLDRKSDAESFAFPTTRQADLRYSHIAPGGAA